jgi:ribosomal protein S27AE
MYVPFSGITQTCPLGVVFQKITLTEGQEVLRKYDDNDTTSGDTLTRQFCSNCGSSLFLSSPTKTDWISVCPGAVEGQEWGECVHGLAAYAITNRISSPSRESPRREVSLGHCTRVGTQVQATRQSLIHTGLSFLYAYLRSNFSIYYQRK